MLTALLLQRIVRHEVVGPFPGEGTYHDRWYRDRRRRRVNAQWRRRLLSPTRDRGRKPWSPELPTLVVTDEDGTEYRDSFPPAKPITRGREVSEDGERFGESLHGRHLLQVPGKRIRENLSDRASVTSTQGTVPFNEEGKSHLKTFNHERQSLQFDKHYDKKESSTLVGQGDRADRQDNITRENRHGDGYRLRQTSFNSTSKQNTGSYKKERDAYIEPATEQQRQRYEGIYVGKESVPSEGRGERTEEREILARENSHDDECRLRHTSINATSRHSTLSTTEERQAQISDGQYAEEEYMDLLDQSNKADERGNNNGDEYRLRHTSIIPTSRHGTGPVRQKNRPNANLLSSERQGQMFDRGHTGEKYAVSKGQGDKNGGRQNVGHENNNDDEYSLVHTTSKQSWESHNEEGESNPETSLHERQMQRFSYVEEESVTSYRQGQNTVKTPPRMQNSNYGDGYRAIYTTSKHSTVSQREERKSNMETYSYEKQERRFDGHYGQEEFVRPTGQWDLTVTEPEKGQNNNRSHHSTYKHSTVSQIEERISNLEASWYERQGQRCNKHNEEEEVKIVSSGGQDDYTGKDPERVQNNYYDENRSHHSTYKHDKVSQIKERKSNLESSFNERQGQCFDGHNIEEEEFVPSSGQDNYTVTETERVQNNNYGDDYRSQHSASIHGAASLSEEHTPLLQTSYYNREGQRFEGPYGEEECVSTNGQEDHTVQESGSNFWDENRPRLSAPIHTAATLTEEHTSSLEPSFHEMQGQRLNYDSHRANERFVPTVHEADLCIFCGTGERGISTRENSHDDGYSLRQTSIRTLASEIKESLAEISKLHVKTSSLKREEYRFDGNFAATDSVHSVSQRCKAEERENNLGDGYRLHNKPKDVTNLGTDNTFGDNIQTDRHLENTGELRGSGVTEDSPAYEDLLRAQGNKRGESTTGTTKNSPVSSKDESQLNSETSCTDRHRIEEEVVPSRGQGDKDGGRENNHGGGYRLQHTPISTNSDKSAVSSNEDFKKNTEGSSSEIQSCHHDVEEDDSWHSKCQHGRAVEWETLARENKDGNKSRLRRMPIKVALREVYTDNWRQYMNVCQESDIGTTDFDEGSTHNKQKDHETYVSQRKIKLRKVSDDTWRLKQPEAINAETPNEGGWVDEYTVTGRDYETEDSRYRSVFEDNNVEREDIWQETDDTRHRSVFEDNGVGDEDACQEKQTVAKDGSRSYISERKTYTESSGLEEHTRHEEETEASRQRSVFEDDHGKEGERTSFFKEWSSLRYTDESATDFAEWSWLLTNDPRAREDASEDGEASYNSADYLAKRHQRLMDLVDGFDEEQLSRLEWFLRQVCLLEEDFDHSLDRRSFDFSEFRADLEFVARTYFDIELRDLELHSADIRNDYLTDEDSASDLETIPESDHEYDADDDGYDMSPSPAPLTSSRVDLHNITTTKGLKRWGSRDSAIGSSIGGTLRSWGSQSTMDGTSDTSGFRLSLDSDVFYFGDMTKYGRKSFGSTPYLSRESYC
ncbi:Hypp691 [Branchiostoma lanceolatum]|uniref:Hypp691 protein n=1 Tax=Branchiostoma lanceolatum TaxID=7740 RepID=A0A8J9WE56_BRALA|nr:Hypp691 [Branchiostoma lanceolatum]